MSDLGVSQAGQGPNLPDGPAGKDNERKCEVVTNPNQSLTGVFNKAHGNVSSSDKPLPQTAKGADLNPTKLKNLLVTDIKDPFKLARHIVRVRTMDVLEIVKQLDTSTISEIREKATPLTGKQVDSIRIPSKNDQVILDFIIENDRKIPLLLKSDNVPKDVKEEIIAYLGVTTNLTPGIRVSKEKLDQHFDLLLKLKDLQTPPSEHPETETIEERVYTPLAEEIKALESLEPQAAKTYKMKPATKLALKAVVKMNKIAKDVGIQRKEKAENLKKKEYIESAIIAIKNTIDQVNIDLESKVNEKKEVIKNLKVEQGVITSGIIVGADLKQFKKTEAVYTEKLKNIETEINLMKELISLNQQEILAYEKSLALMNTQESKDQKLEVKEQRVEQMEVSSEKVPVTSTPTVELETEITDDVTDKVDLQPTVSDKVEVDLPVQPLAVKPSERAVISEATKKELFDYLNTINKTGEIALKGRGKELEKRANDLSDKLDFFNYMGVVSSDSKCKDSFKGILKQKLKANVMLVQLQKTLQKEMGTYNKDYDKKLIKSEEKLNEEIEYYARNNKLDPDQLAQLMSEVSIADTKTRVGKTTKLISYMIGG